MITHQWRVWMFSQTYSWFIMEWMRAWQGRNLIASPFKKWNPNILFGVCASCFCDCISVWGHLHTVKHKPRYGGLWRRHINCQEYQWFTGSQLAEWRREALPDCAAGQQQDDGCLTAISLCLMFPSTRSKMMYPTVRNRTSCSTVRQLSMARAAENHSVL